jgi:hypothetical protein
LRLIALPKDLEYFLGHLEGDPGFMLLICSLERQRSYGEPESTRLFDELMRKAWNPDFFKK